LVFNTNLKKIILFCFTEYGSLIQLVSSVTLFASLPKNSKNFDFESCNNIFTPKIESIMLASKVLKDIKKKKEVKNDLLSMMAPPIIQSCSDYACNWVLCIIHIV